MPEVPPVSRASDLVSAVEASFADHGPLARVLPGFEPRAGQRAMARAVARSFEEGSTLLVEAGTGTGKTLAYLVPAILSRQRVLISTGTKTLQEQIYSKDLPLLADALGVPVRATFMKGRGNYLCLHRYDLLSEAPENRSPQDRFHLELIGEWAGRTDTGDRAELEDLPEDLPFWSDISATSEHCVGPDCPRYDDCFVTRMRQRAAEADLVIVNHHLLCADASVRQSAFGEVIPGCALAVIDEAHQLEDVATQYFGLGVSNYRVEELARDADRVVAGSALARSDVRDEIVALIDKVRDRGRSFFARLPTELLPGRPWQLRDGSAVADERVRLSADALSTVIEDSWHLTGAIEALEAALSLAKESPEDALSIARRAGELRDQLRFILRAADPDFVYFLEVRGRGVFLRAAPIDVSALIRDLLLGRVHATVLTSATLAIAGSFEYVRSRLGVLDARELQLESEFDYRRQAILYLPRQMPDPRSPGFGTAAAAEIVEILRRTRGRAFVLFTSYATLRHVFEQIAPVVTYPTFVQGMAPRSALLRQFRTTPHSVLFATSSFWQGVDVAGEALSCVIIDKLPFASPNDPITAARIQSIEARGGSAFGEYQVPLAILTLLQGLGRLIRHRQDHGVLAILDPRVKRMGYGRHFLEALPPAPITSSLDGIDRFFASFPAEPPSPAS